MLYVSGEGGVGNELALGHFGVKGEVLPVVCDEEDGVGVFQDGVDRLSVVQVGLGRRESILIKSGGNVGDLRLRSRCPSKRALELLASWDLW